MNRPRRAQGPGRQALQAAPAEPGGWREVLRRVLRPILRLAPLLALVAGLLSAVSVWADEVRRPGSAYMSPATQALQRDDTQNPAFLWVRDGERRFAAQCAGCHAAADMRGVAARYPAIDARTGQALTLAGRIRTCHERHLRQSAPGWESEPLLALLAFVTLPSRGMPIAPPADARLDTVRAAGEALWRQPFGQLGLACAQCHDRLPGQRLAGSTIPQAHPTGYPIYRLEWQGLGTLQRRMRGCLSAVRAEPFDEGAPQWVALEAMLMRRAAGMPLDAPGVRP